MNAANKDRLGALMCIALGLGAILIGRGYGVGHLRDAGAGFLPVAIGVLMVIAGIAIALTAGAHVEEAKGEGGGHGGGKAPDLRGAACIIGALLAFAILGVWGGLVPASFACVFIAAMGDRENSPKAAALLAAGITVFGVVVFYFLLSLQFPLFRWG